MLARRLLIGLEPTNIQGIGDEGPGSSIVVVVRRSVRNNVLEKSFSAHDPCKGCFEEVSFPLSSRARTLSLSGFSWK